MEQNEAMNMPTYDSVRQKSGTGLKIALVFTLLLAIGGAGFGVYTMMQGSEKDNKIADLENQVKSVSNDLIAAKDPANIYADFTESLIKGNTDKKEVIFDLNASGQAVMAEIDGSNNNHLTISVVDGAKIVEDDEVLSVYRLSGVGNGGNRYFYYIKKDGSVFRVQIFPDDAAYGKSVEANYGHKNIVTIMDGSGFCPRLIDMAGNIYDDCGFKQETENNQ